MSVPGEPLSPSDAKNLCRQIVEEGLYRFSSHAEEELAKDKLTNVDCVNVLRGGWVEPAEFVNGQWRYRVCTNKMVVVVSFLDPKRLRIVTAWRLTR